MIEVTGNATPHSLEQQEQIIEAALERKDQEKRNWGIVLTIAGRFLLDEYGPADISFWFTRKFAADAGIDLTSWSFQEVAQLRRAVIQVVGEIEG